MSYQSTVNEMRTAAEAVNPNGRFDHGRKLDLSEKHEGKYPFIFLYPLNVTPGVDPNFVDTSTVLIGFWQQDSPDSKTVDRESLIAQMDALSTSFIAQLLLNKKVRITNLSKEPQYQMYQSTVSGMAIRFNYQNFTPCP